MPYYCVSTYIIMDFYQSLGYLILGSRMRRLSESMLAEINKVYQDAEVEFDASWFPLFYSLDKRDMSIRELADQIQISHSAVSQMVSNLKKKNLVSSSANKEDARSQVITFTPEGHALLQQVKPIWHSITQVLEDLAKEKTEINQLLLALTELENDFEEKRLSERIQQTLSVQ